MSGLTLTARPLTVDDYRVLPTEGPRCELIEGDIHMLPSPSEFHQQASNKLAWFLESMIMQGSEGALFHAPFDVFLDESNAVQPDLLWISDENLARLDQGFHGAPDLVVEILSPTNSTRDLEVKRRLYQAHSAREIWIVDPLLKTVQIDRLGAHGYEEPRHFGVDDTVTTPLLPGLAIPLQRVFHYAWVGRERK
jgi:Uma2 family endonuclease